MKSVFVVLAALTASVAAQGLLPGGPECSNKCVTKVVTEGVDDCPMDDFKCICGNDAFIDSIGQCILGACNDADVKKTITAAYNLCKLSGVEIPTTVPTLNPTTTPTPTGSTNTTNSSTTSTGAPEETTTDSAATNLIVNGLSIAGIAAAVLLL